MGTGIAAWAESDFLAALDYGGWVGLLHYRHLAGHLHRNGASQLSFVIHIILSYGDILSLLSAHNPLAQLLDCEYLLITSLKTTE